MMLNQETDGKSCEKCGDKGCNCDKSGDAGDAGGKIIGVLTEQLSGVTDPSEIATILRDMADVLDEGGLNGGEDEVKGDTMGA
jgi:hypothetical protein